MSHSTYLPEKMGSAVVEPRGSFEAGSYQQFTVTYTAGYFGIDDTGSLKIVHRFASDMGRPQFDNPAGPNFTTAEASNGAVLHVEYDMKRNIRPWDKTLYIKVVRGFLREGDQIVVRFGDQRHGSPGIRLQTFCEDTFEFRVLVDAIATYNYVELPEQPVIRIIPGPAALIKGIMPTSKAVGERFDLRIKAEDKWGNPTNQCDDVYKLKANIPVQGLPESIRFVPGEFEFRVSDLSVNEVGDLLIYFMDASGNMVARANPNRIADSLSLRPFWGDLHGQSEETIGTNSARDFYEFARDKAFLDVCVHQGNDFQITSSFWQLLNELSAEFNKDNEFVVFPGWEWSGNTGLGGDRNVLMMEEGRQIHRSSHALVDDLSDVQTDANSAEDLFTMLKDEDCVVFAHIGGRYADIKIAHDKRLERSVEVHSAWGTFEWLIEDAFEQGFRVGIMSNSDGHKGRPGASHPGATKFGSYGGLTCMLSDNLSRGSIMESLRRRHHYGTTGCRTVLETRVDLPTDGRIYDEDPNLGDVSYRPGKQAIMGDIAGTNEAVVGFSIDVVSSSPIERIDIRNGLETLEVYRPYEKSWLGKRIRVIWEGSEYRGRGRETIWDGAAGLSDNKFVRVSPINRYNQDKRFDLVDDNKLEWNALTTGGFGGFDAWLENGNSGTLSIATNLINETVRIEDIGLNDIVFENGGIDRRIRIFRLPDENTSNSVSISRKVILNNSKDNPLYVRVTQEDGHYVWSSPVYLIGLV
jgi:hypothetical protein